MLPVVVGIVLLIGGLVGVAVVKAADAAMGWRSVIADMDPSARGVGVLALGVGAALASWAIARGIDPPAPATRACAWIRDASRASGHHDPPGAAIEARRVQDAVRRIVVDER